MQKLIIVGAGGFGRELLQMVKEINEISPTWKMLGFLDDDSKALHDVECEFSIIGGIEGWKPIGNEVYAIALANPKLKKRVVSALEAAGCGFATIIHPTARVSDHVKVGKGLIMKSYSSISVNVEIGDFAFFNLMAGAGHDCVIGDFCMLGPRCSLSGHTTLGEGVTVGAHASTYPGVAVGDYATIGMNSAAVRKVKSNTTVMGVPAKVI